MNILLITVYGTILTIFFIAVMIFAIIVMYIKTGHIIRNVIYLEKISQALRGAMIESFNEQTKKINLINEQLINLEKKTKVINEKKINKIDKIMERINNKNGVYEKEDTLIDYNSENIHDKSFIGFDDETEISVLKKPL